MTRLTNQDLMDHATQEEPWDAQLPPVRGTCFVLACLQLLLGAFGFFGVFCFLIEPLENTSRGQLLTVPVYTFLVAVPLLIVSAIFYRRCKLEMTMAERWLFKIGCALPILALAVALSIGVCPWLGRLSLAWSTVVGS